MSETTALPKILAEMPDEECKHICENLFGLSMTVGYRRPDYDWFRRALSQYFADRPVLPVLPREPSEAAVEAALIASNADSVPPIVWPTDYTRGAELEWRRHMKVALRAAYAVDGSGERKL